MKVKKMFLLFFLLFTCTNINAKQIIIKNKSSDVLKILPVPEAILRIPNKEKILLLQNNIAFVKPNNSVKLKFTQLESIEIKILDPSNNKEFWYKYDQERTPELFNLINSTTTNKEPIKLVVFNPGDIYQIKPDNTLRIVPGYSPPKKINFNTQNTQKPSSAENLLELPPQ